MKAIVVVFDAVAKISPHQARTVLKPNGIYLNVHRDSHATRDTTMLQDLLRLKELLEAGKLKPVVDRVYRLGGIVETHRYVDAGHKKGNVVITLGHSDHTQGDVAITREHSGRTECSFNKEILHTQVQRTLKVHRTIPKHLCSYCTSDELT